MQRRIAIVVLLTYNIANFDRAIEDCNTAIQFKLDLVEAYINRGVAFNGKEYYDCAIADYNKAIQLKPDFAEAYINRGVAYGKKAEYNRAIEDYTTAIRLKPTLAEAYNNRGGSFLQTGRLYLCYRGL